MSVMQEIEKFNFEKGTISSLLSLCCKCSTKEEATRIIERYGAVNKYVNKNLGYIFGYCGPVERTRLYKLFPVNHPIFGSGFGRGKDPTSEEAFNKGKEMAIKLQKD